MQERWWFSNHGDVGREKRCWHTTFQCLHVNAKSSSKNVLDGKGKSHAQRYPVELVMVGVEGLRTLKPQIQKQMPSAMVLENGKKENVETVGGINLESCLVLYEDNVVDEMVKWEVESLKFSVNQLIEAVVTKDELQHLAFLCKSEIDSTGRVAAGILRLLKLEGSVGQAAIDQLSNLGSEGIDNIFSSIKLSRGNSSGSIGLSPSSVLINGRPYNIVESTLTMLEEVVVDSQVKLTALITNLGTSESSIQHLLIIKQLGQNIEYMQGY